MRSLRTPGILPLQSRIVEPMIAARLRRAGGVLITGPRAVGKTTTALAFARSEVRLDQDRAALLAARTDPRLVLDGEFPRLLDEYQLVDGLWEAVRGGIDERRLRGAYLLTGSATPDPELRLHSGAGRIAVVAMRTMSFFERGFSSGAVSTEKLLQGYTPGATSDRILAAAMPTAAAESALGDASKSKAYAARLLAALARARSPVPRLR